MGFGLCADGHIVDKRAEGVMLPAILACELFPSVRCAGVRMREGGGSRGAGAFPPSEGENAC